jgi:hypothetical protein
MSSKEENSDFTYLGKRIDKALNYVQTNKPGLIEWFKEYIETPYLNIIYGELELEEEDYTFDYLDSLLDDIEEKFNIIFETKQIMSNEFKRMTELAGLPTTETTPEENTTESLNENFVGIPAINNVFEREKTDYELAFEHFTKSTSILEDYDKASQEMEEESLHQEESEELEEGNGLRVSPDNAVAYLENTLRSVWNRGVGKNDIDFQSMAQSIAQDLGLIEDLEEGIHDKDITSAPHTNVKGEMGNYDPKKRAANLAKLQNFGPKDKK